MTFSFSPTGVQRSQSFVVRPVQTWARPGSISAPLPARQQVLRAPDARIADLMLGKLCGAVLQYCFAGITPIENIQRHVESSVAIAKIIEAYCAPAKDDANKLIHYALTHGKDRLQNDLKDELQKTRGAVQALDISGIPIQESDLLLDFLGLYPQVKRFDLSSCKLERRGYECLQNLRYFRAIEELNLSDNEIDATCDQDCNRYNLLQSLQELKNLRVLRLRKTVMPDSQGLIEADFLALTGHPALSYLDVGGNVGMCTEGMLALYEGLPALQTLVLRDCPDLDWGFVYRVTEALPNLALEHHLPALHDSNEDDDPELVSIANLQIEDASLSS